MNERRQRRNWISGKSSWAELHCAAYCWNIYSIPVFWSVQPSSGTWAASQHEITFTESQTDQNIVNNEVQEFSSVVCLFLRSFLLWSSCHSFRCADTQLYLYLNKSSDLFCVVSSCVCACMYASVCLSHCLLGHVWSVRVCMYMHVCVCAFSSPHAVPDRLRLRVNRISLQEYDRLQYDKERLRDICKALCVS